MRRPSIGPRARRSTCSITTCASGSRPRAARPRPRSASSCRPSTTCSRPAARWCVITSSAACCARRGSTSRSGDKPMITAAAIRTWELDRNPDLIDLVAAARDAGHEVMLVERPMPDAVSVAALGRAYDLVSAPEGAALLGAAGEQLDFEPGPVVAAAATLWARLAAREGGAEHGPTGTGLVALGGFAFRPQREPAGPWAGFPALLLRVPALAVTRVRGRTYASPAVADAEELLEIPASFRAPGARKLEITPARPAADWEAAVAEAGRRLAAGEAEKVVLAREVVAHADGAVAAAAVARALRAAYPACFTYLVTGGDGTAFIGASPELLVKRAGTLVTAQPLAGSVVRGADEAEDDRLAASLLGERFLAEHR